MYLSTIVPVEHHLNLSYGYVPAFAMWGYPITQLAWDKLRSMYVGVKKAQRVTKAQPPLLTKIMVGVVQVCAVAPPIVSDTFVVHIGGCAYLHWEICIGLVQDRRAKRHFKSAG
jgi:hypothetical protein